jgi:sterol desaturase/sphingolipid hydroxylase (fatty acid hydroxylase superfamily)
MFNNLIESLKIELEASKPLTKFKSGWISGVLALFLGIIGLGAVFCFHYPDLLTVPEIRSAIDVVWVRIILHIVLIAGFTLASISLILRQNKVLGLSAITVILIAVVLGGSKASATNEINTGIYFSLDWFILNLILSGIIFLPLERLFPRNDQSVFRFEWREDLFYFLVSSVLVQVLTFLSYGPAKFVLPYVQQTSIQNYVVGQPLWLQVIEIMLLTDFVQYWVHRLFHKIPFLWKFHAVHHSAQKLDWLAGSRMHFIEIVSLRSMTVIPMFVLGFAQPAIYAYLIIIYLYSTYIHSNLKFDIEFLKPIIVTPRYHHWHHGIEKEAIDINFSIHFPFLDRIFGTYYMPKGKWPIGYGVAGDQVPSGYIKQFKYPFTSTKTT